MIRVQGLTRRFGDFTAVSRMSFVVPEGEIFGFIGPNGAGKTTTIRILATLLLPTSGRAEVFGWEVTEHPERVRDVMGYMPDMWGVYPDITVTEYLDFFAAAYGISRRDRPRTVGDVMELTDLSGLSRKLVEHLSKGMKQRLCLAKTLIHDPRLLILDEPASGLDPRARIELRELLRELANMGKTILISSHILTELSDLVTSVGIVERGRMLMSGDVESIVQRLTRGEVQARRPPAPVAAQEGGVLAALHEARAQAQLQAGIEASDAPVHRFTLRTTELHLQGALEHLLSDPNLIEGRIVGEREVVFSFQGEEAYVAEVVRGLARASIDVIGLREEKADLESVFMAITRGQVQ